MGTFISFTNLEHFLLQREKIRRIPTSSHIQNAYAILCSHLGESSIQFIQILGTNGKGSTSTYLEALALEHSFSSGLFTSPHFLSIRERIRCNGHTLCEDEWLEAANYIEDLIHTDTLLTFEYFLLIALYLFHKYAISLAIIEAGLGGVYDSTSLLPYSVQVFTAIDIDHQHILGITLCDIALQKISALQNNILCASAIQKQQVKHILEDIAENRNVTLSYTTNTCPYPLSLKGKFQEENAALALLAFSLFLSLTHEYYKEDCVQKAFKKAFIPGRIQHVKIQKTSLLLDGAHNNHSLLALKEYIRTIPISYIIFSTKYKSNLTEYLALIRSFHTPTLYVSVNEKNMLSFQDICELAPFLHQSTSLQDALCFTIPRTPENHTILITGSLYLLASFFSLYPETLHNK
ncbi:MAG: hypothetical protein ACRCV3_02940 [Desulfovibrionaceae bacterium]